LYASSTTRAYGCGIANSVGCKVGMFKAGKIDGRRKSVFRS
jgi:hypothetical protein